MDERILRLREEAKSVGEPVLRDESFSLLLKEVKKRRPKKILEVGTNVGLTGAAMLCELPDAHLTGIEIDSDKIARAKANYALFGVADRAKIFCGDASEIIPVLTGEYDFVFLDGPKGHYYDYLFDLLSVLKVGGVLCADNVLYRGFLSGKVKVPHRHATILHSLQKFMDEITSNAGLSTVVYDIEDGISVTEKLR